MRACLLFIRSMQQGMHARYHNSYILHTHTHLGRAPNVAPAQKFQATCLAGVIPQLPEMQCKHGGI